MQKRSEARRIGLIAALLAAGTLLVYAPVTGFVFTNYDDPQYVVENPQVRAGLTGHGFIWAFSSIDTGNWHPLTWVSHMLDCQLYGLKPGSHHFTSVLFHTANSVLVFLLLRLLTGAIWRSAAVAALFALHPLHVESVAWVAERKDVLSACLGLLSLCAYVKYARAAQSPGKDNPRVWYGLALGFFCLGLMSKAMLVTWPCVMLLLDFWPLRRWLPGAALRRLWLEKLPFFVLSAGASVATVIAQKAGGALAPLAHVPMSARFENVLISYGRYLGKVLWPAKLAVFYPNVLHWPVWEVLVAGLSLIVATLLVWGQRRQRAFLLVGWFWYLGTLVPVIGLVQVGNQSMADRYMYLPSIGLFVMASWGVGERIGSSLVGRQAAAVWTGILLLICFVVTSSQLRNWRDTETLFRHALAVTQDNTVAYNSLGFYYAGNHDPAQAGECFNSALAINPSDAVSWSGLAKVKLDQSRWGEAVANAGKALELNPALADAHTTLGQALNQQGKESEALAQYTEVVRLRPDSSIAHYNLANAFARQGQLDKARTQYEQALRLDPDSVSAHSNLGYILSRQGQLEPAAYEFRVALELQPDFWQARFGLGDILGRQGQFDDAIRELNYVLRQKPELNEARQRLQAVIAAKDAAAAKGAR